MAEFLKIIGGQQLRGEVEVSGAKNSALPLLISGLLSAEKTVFTNVPGLEDISVTLRLLKSLGAEISWQDKRVEIATPKIIKTEASYSLVRSLRASFWVLGPLLARAGEARVSLPGGDAIGSRPVDLHLKGLEALGAEIKLQHGVVTASAPNGLHGAEFELGFPSVGATHQILMTAALIPEETVIRGAAAEPEVVELAEHLQRGGVSIEGAGTSTIRIFGVKELSASETEVLGDRIEAATYLAAVAMCGGSITLNKVKADNLGATLDVLKVAGCRIEVGADSLKLEAADLLKSVSFATEPFPGLATDVQPILMAMMCVASGESRIEENIFESRFGHVAEFRRFGAKIEVDGDSANVVGVAKLSGAPVSAGDIRAAAALVLMGLAAEGETTIHEIFHLDRGYDGLCDKLSRLGANIRRVELLEDQEMVFGC